MKKLKLFLLILFAFLFISCQSEISSSEASYFVETGVILNSYYKNTVSHQISNSMTNEEIRDCYLNCKQNNVQSYSELCDSQISSRNELSSFLNQKFSAAQASAYFQILDNGGSCLLFFEMNNTNDYILWMYCIKN